MTNHFFKFKFQEFTEDKFEENFLDAITKYKPSSVTFYANHLVRLAETEKLQQYSLKGKTNSSSKYVVTNARSEDRLISSSCGVEQGSKVLYTGFNRNHIVWNVLRLA